MKESSVKLKSVVRLAVFVVLGGVAASCASQQPAKDAVAPKVIRGQEYGRLEMFNVTTSPTIDSVILRGVFRNPYDEPIEGIRVVLRFTENRDPKSRIILRAQNQMDSRLAPGETVPFAISVKADPHELVGAGTLLEGCAMRRGGEVLPASPAWQE